MNSFSSNPIVIRQNGKMLGVIELDFDPETRSFSLEIKNKEGKVLYNGAVDEDTFLSYEVTEEVLSLAYTDTASHQVFYRNEIDLYEKFSLYPHLEKDGLPIQDKETFFKRVVTQVKEEMDNPKGTDMEIEHHTFMLNQCTMKESARLYVTNKIRQIISRNEGLSEEEIEEYTRKIYANFYGMGILQDLDDDIDVGEIAVNAYIYPQFRCDVYYWKKGKKIKSDLAFKNLDELTNVFSRAIAFSKKELNNLENALVEATRSNRDRVNIVIPDASESYVMNIRKFGNFVPNLNAMREYGTVDAFIDRLMGVLVQGKANIGIGGPMGTGKTTFINYLLSYTPKEERKVVIASVSETDVERVLAGHDVVIFNVDETKKFTFERLVRASLRTTADRVIIPESRGEEFRQIYEANLKTKGNMFTAHALDDYAFLDMCVDMYTGGNGSGDVGLMRSKIAKALDVVIIMRKVGDSIRIKSISEVVTDENANFQKMNMLYYWHNDPEDMGKGEYRRTDKRLSEAFKLRLNEYGVPMSVMRDL